MPEVTPDIEEKIRVFYEDSYTHYDRFNFKQALRGFYHAWILIPKPQSQYSVAGQVLTAIGDCYFKMRQYDCGKEALRSALHCPGTLTDPFLHLRLGQCCYELHQREQAYQEFTLVMKLGGYEMFDRETSKYINFYRKQKAFKSVPATSG